MKKILFILFAVLFAISGFTQTPQISTSATGKALVIPDTSSTANEGYIYHIQNTDEYYYGTVAGHYASITDTNTIVNIYNVSWYGVSWDAGEDTYTRLGFLADSSADATIPNAYLPIQSKMKRCLLKNDGTVYKYLRSDN